MDTPNQKDLDARLALMGELRLAARAITLPIFSAPMAVTNKADSGYDPVTAADIEGERALRAIIQNTLPDDSIEGEELPDIQGANDWLWTLDPIDGTRGFVAGVPVWSTLIAVSYQGHPVLGLIDHPALNTSFWGAPGRAWQVKDGVETPLKTKDCARINDGILGCTEPLSMLDPG